MGIDQWEWEGMGILIVFPHTSTAEASLLSGSAAPVVAAGGGGECVLQSSCWRRVAQDDE